MNELESLAKFTGGAEPFLRFGTRHELPDELINQVRRLVGAYFRLPPDYADPHLTLYLRAARNLADVLDRLGDYHGVEDVLLFFSRVEPRIDAICKDKVPDDPPERQLELLWIAYARSVSMHRRGEFDRALGLTRLLLRSKTITGSTELRARVNYAQARHFQSSGRAADADVHFTAAFDQCSILSDEGARANDPAIIRYAQVLNGIFVVQFSRAALEKGELRRAWRLLTMAHVFLAVSEDELPRAFVDLLKGCVLRQERRLNEAIDLLNQSCEVFERTSHVRYHLRALHELASAYFNRAMDNPDSAAADYSQAHQSLQRSYALAKNRSGRYTGDERTRTRWQIKRKILEARICKEQEKLADASLLIDQALAEFQKLHMAGTSHDLSALLTAVRGEILLALGKAEEAVAICRDWQRQDSRGETIDRTDEAWVQVVLWKAGLLTSRMDLARKCEASWKSMAPNIENHYVKRFADEVQVLHREHEKGLYFSTDGSHGPDAWNVDKWSFALREFLVVQVRALYPNETLESQAERLGVKRQTLANWLSQKPKRD